MSLDLQHHPSKGGAMFIAWALPVLLLLFVPWPKLWRWKAPLMVFASWFLLVAYCAFILFPIGSAWVEEKGFELWDYYDNNNFVPILFTGWIYPALTIIVACLCRFGKNMIFNKSDRHRECA